MPDRAMIDRIKSLLENKKRQLMATHGPDNAGFSHTTEDHPATHIQPVVRTGTGVVFPVDNVVPASDPLWLGTLRESVEIRTDASILIMPDQDIPAIAPEGYFTKPAAEGPRMPWRLAMRTLWSRPSISHSAITVHSCLPRIASGSPLSRDSHTTFWRTLKVCAVVSCVTKERRNSV
jgi:hypothetical protein